MQAKRRRCTINGLRGGNAHTKRTRKQEKEEKKEEEPYNPWTRPRYGSEWSRAAANAPATLFAFWPPNEAAERVLVASTLTARPPALRPRLTPQRDGPGLAVREECALLWAAAAARNSPGQWHFALAQDVAQLPPSQRAPLPPQLPAGERLVWVRRPIRAAHGAGDALEADARARFPWRAGDALRLFDTDTLEWAGDARIGRVGVRPQQGGDGAAATGYVTIIAP